MLKDEEEDVEGNEETTEIVFDSGGGLIEVPDLEDSSIKVNSGSDLVSSMLNLHVVEGFEPEASTTLDSIAKKSVREVTEETPPFEAIQELPDKNLEVEEVGDLPEEKPSEETNVKWLEEPAIVEIKDVKEEEPTPNTNPNLFSPPIQTQSFQAIIQDTAANLVAIRPNPWPNKPPIHTIFNRPKPWPDEPPKYIEHNLRSSSEETIKLTYGEVEDEASNGGEVSPDSKRQQKRSVGQIRVFQVTDQAPIPAQPVPLTSVMFLLLYDFQNLKVGKIPQNHFQNVKNKIVQFMVLQVADRNWNRFQHRGLSTSSRTAVANETNKVCLRSTDDVSVAFKQLYTVHCNSWTIGTTSTSSPDLYRLRSILESQPMVLPVYDPGDFRSKEDEGRISFDFNGCVSHFGRIFEGFRRRIVVSSRRFSEKRRIGNPRKGIENQREQKKIWGIFSRDFNFMKVEEARVSNDLIWGFRLLGVSEINWEFWKFTSRDFCWSKMKNWGFRLSKKKKRFGFQSSCVELKREAARVMFETRSDFIRLALKPKTGSLLGFRRIGSSTNLGKWGNICNYQIRSSTKLGRLGNICNYQILQFRVFGRPEQMVNKWSAALLGLIKLWAVWASYRIILSFNFNNC